MYKVWNQLKIWRSHKNKWEITIQTKQKKGKIQITKFEMIKYSYYSIYKYNLKDS